MDHLSLPKGFQSTVERPATLIVVGMNVILGVALAIALILKIYMLVFTDYLCEPDVASLGNAIRCTSLLETMSAFIAASATVAAAFALLVQRTTAWSRALVLAAAAAFVALLDVFVAGDYNWRLSLAVGVLFCVVFLAMSWPKVLPGAASGSPGNDTDA